VRDVLLLLSLLIARFFPVAGRQPGISSKPAPTGRRRAGYHDALLAVLLFATTPPRHRRHGPLLSLLSNVSLRLIPRLIPRP
jgi:hypothetical protein